jgi:hypothetical protein
VDEGPRERDLAQAEQAVHLPVLHATRECHTRQNQKRYCLSSAKGKTKSDIVSLVHGLTDLLYAVHLPVLHTGTAMQTS